MLIVLLFSISVAFAKSNTIHLHKSQPKFIITLESNRTTGYSWSLKDYDNKLIRLINHGYLKPNSNLIGAPGHDQWVFQGNPEFFTNAKPIVLTLNYARSWEHGKNIKTVTYKIIPVNN